MKKSIIIIIAILLLACTLTSCKEVEYELCFIVDGETYHSVVTNGNEVITMPQIPTKEGYEFVGWFWDKNTYKKRVTEDSLINNPISDNKLIYPHWIYKSVIKRSSYTITFNSNGGSYIDALTNDKNNKTIEPEQPTKSGYTFDGWFIDDITFNDMFNFMTIPVDDVALFAKWNINNYTLTFNSNGGSYVGSVTDIYGAKVLPPSPPERPDYTFEGWYQDDNTFSNKYQFTTIPLDGVALYARWSINKNTITFHSNGGDLVDGITKSTGESVTAPQNPNRLGYTFDGWYSDDGTFINKYIFAIIPLEGIALYAKWTANSYTIIFNSNGGSFVDSITNDYDQRIYPPKPPKKAGCTFDGWYTDDGIFTDEYIFTTTPLDGITLYAKWNQATFQKVNALDEPSQSGEYILLGEFPQTIKDNEVVITDTIDARDYFLGNDNFYYAKVSASPYGNDYSFSSSEEIVINSIYYFKVEPIRWRILSEVDGKAIVLCDSIIANKRFDELWNNYKNSEIRAWLNDEFYNIAFSSIQKNLIETSYIDNYPSSAGYDALYSGCENTQDKIFLPSYREMVNTSYGFNGDFSANDAFRCKQTSDFTRATGAVMSKDSSFYGNGMWWLRSPYNNNATHARFVGHKGNGNTENGSSVFNTSSGIVPALTIKIK